MQPLKELSEFGKWKVNLDHYSLKNDKGEELLVEPRLLKALHFLCAKANQAVKCNKLTDHIRKDVVVAEKSLSKAIFDLRRFLAANFKDAPQILTILRLTVKAFFRHFCV